MFVFYFISVKTPTVLSPNSTDLYNCVAQRAVQHQPLTRGTWFDWMGSGWKQHTHCAWPTLPSCPQGDLCHLPMASTLTGALLCLSAARQAINTRPTRKLVWFSSAAGSFELALSAVNLWKEASVQDKTSPKCWLLSKFFQKTSLLANLRNHNIKVMSNHLPAALCSYPFYDLFSPVNIHILVIWGWCKAHPSD